MSNQTVIQEGRRKGLVIRQAKGAVTIRMPDGEVYVPRDGIDLRHFVETYRPVNEQSVDPSLANQILDRSPRS